MIYTLYTIAKKPSYDFGSSNSRTDDSDCSSDDYEYTYDSSSADYSEVSRKYKSSTPKTTNNKSTSEKARTSETKV